MTTPAVPGSRLFSFVMASLLAVISPCIAMADEGAVQISRACFALTATRNVMPSLTRADIVSDGRSEAKSLTSVDWSPWIGRLADRWFNRLKQAEDRSNMRFLTIQPALIQFTCYADGHIGSVVIKQSSGVPLYDRIQVQALLATCPLPPFPAGTQRSSLTLTQGWESRFARPGENEFEATTFAARFPQENVTRWAATNPDGRDY